MVVYLSGPISGRHELNRPAFQRAAERIREAGHEVLNPHDMVPADCEWHRAMRICVGKLVNEADEVVMLDGWTESRDSLIEKNLANDLKIPVYYSIEDLLMRQQGGSDGVKRV